jgi:hypothetical protein
VTVRALRIFILCAIALVAGGMVLGLAFVGYGAAAGHAAQTTLPLRIEPAQALPVLDRASHLPAGELLLDHGTLNLRAGGTGYAFLQALDIILTGGMWLLVLISILGLVRQFGRGRTFESSSVRRLRIVGWSLIGLNLWAWIRMLALPPVLLAAIDPDVGKYRILPSVAQGIANVRNARVDASYGVGLLAVGLLVLVLAQAFTAGVAFREDSEAIV